MIDIPVSIGELLDKITILQIKEENTDNVYIKLELGYLTQTALQHDVYNEAFLELLKEVNRTLWDIEDNIRIKEKENSFDDEFIELARSVYITNDKRAKIKSDINEYYDSPLREIKLY
jgi:hypothetical protein